MKIIGIKFEGYNKFGDFEYICHKKEYKDSLFIFNDNEEYHNTCNCGSGNAIMRKYNKYNTELKKPKSAGIHTGTLVEGGYSELNDNIKLTINNAINEIKDLILKYNYDTIYYSIGKNNKLGTGIFEVHEDVIDYIDNLLNLL
jgi:hypothetical protein